MPARPAACNPDFHDARSCCDTCKSKTVDEFRNVDLDYVITMGCGDACPFIRAKHREDWDIPDPRNFPVKNFIIIRDLIERKVKQLITKIENENANNKR